MNDIRSEKRVLFHGGDVYSPADPFATAMIVEGDSVAWVGSDEAAEGMAAKAEGLEIVDLRGALITPGFVDAHVRLTEAGLAESDTAGEPSPDRVAARTAALRSAAARGIIAVHDMSWPDDGPVAERSSLAETSDLPEVFGYLERLAASAEEIEEWRHALPGFIGLAVAVDGSIEAGTAAFREPYGDIDPAPEPMLSAEEIARHVLASTSAGLPSSFSVTGDAALDVALSGFEEAIRRAGKPAVASAGHRLEHLTAVDDEQIARIVDAGVLAILHPAFDAVSGDRSRAFGERAGRLNRIGSLISAGAPVALGSAAPTTPLDPWGAVRAAVFHGNTGERVSARAAFTAHTRGGWRAIGDFGKGVLAPGSPASFAVWESGDLLVQVADERLAAWSTDPRSGTPGLPDLTEPGFRPECLLTVHRGRTLFRKSSWPAS